MAHRWTKEEDAIIREHYPSVGAKGCVEVLGAIGNGRTAGAVKERAKTLRVKRDMSSVERSNDNVWTDDEIAILRDSYPSLGAQGTREALAEIGSDRTAGAITTRAAMLGIRQRNTKRRMERAGETKLVNFCLDTQLDAEIISHLGRQRNRSAYIRGLLERDIAQNGALQA